MKSIKYFALIASFSLHTNVYGNSLLQFYGNINLAAEHLNESNDFQDRDDDFLQNKASRIGIYGSKNEEDHSIFYRLEYGVNIVDKKNKDTLFLRDVYVGMQNEYGNLKLGYSNTPFKLSQGKVDVFNDVVDLSTLLPGDNVESMLAIESSQFNGLKVNIAYLLNDNPNAPKKARQGFSSSLSYNYNNINLALAYEKGTTGQDLIRVSGNYHYEEWLFGFMFQKNQVNSYFKNNESGRLVSIKYKFGRMALKFQAIDSNFTAGTKRFYGMTGNDNKSLTVGIDYHLLNTGTIMLYSTHGKSNLPTNKSEKVNVLGVGMKINF